MYTKENLTHLAQLELLYKAAMHVLRADNIEVDEKHNELFDAIPDHDSVDLLDTINILRDIILQQDEYSDHLENEED